MPADRRRPDPPAQATEGSGASDRSNFLTTPASRRLRREARYQEWSRQARGTGQIPSPGPLREPVSRKGTSVETAKPGLEGTRRLPPVQVEGPTSQQVPVQTASRRNLSAASPIAGHGIGAMEIQGGGLKTIRTNLATPPARRRDATAPAAVITVRPGPPRRQLRKNPAAVSWVRTDSGADSPLRYLRKPSGRSPIPWLTRVHGMDPLWPPSLPIAPHKREYVHANTEVLGSSGTDLDEQAPPPPRASERGLRVGSASRLPRVRSASPA